MAVEARGYLVEAEYDGERLVARGTNKASHFALRGQGSQDGDLVLRASEISNVTLKRSSGPMGAINGKVEVHAAGKVYQLHFRRKQTDDFARLVKAMGY